jgi:DNA transformation protein
LYPAAGHPDAAARFRMRTGTNDRYRRYRIGSTIPHVDDRHRAKGGIDPRPIGTDLARLPNLGKLVVGQLEKVGISTADELRGMGSIDAALRLRESGVDVCASKLCALEGAIRGVRWHAIPEAERAALRRRFDARIAKSGRDGRKRVNRRTGR